MRRIILLGMVLFSLVSTALAQKNATITVDQQIVGTNVEYTVWVQAASAGDIFRIGPSDIVLDFPAGCLTIGSGSKLAGSDATLTSFTQSVPAVPVYEPVTVNFNGALNRVLIQVKTNPINVTGNEGVSVPTAKTFQVVRFSIPISDCNCANPNPTFGLTTNLSELISTAGNQDFQDVNITSRTVTPLDRAPDFAPSTATVNPTSILRCTGPLQVEYRTLTAAYFRLNSTNGSVFNAGGTVVGPTTSVFVDVGPGNGITPDEIQVSNTNTFTCYESIFTAITPAPSASFSLSLVEAQACSGTPFNIFQSGSEAGVTYQLLERAPGALGFVPAPLVPSVLSTANGQTFTYTLSRPSSDTLSYAYKIRATRGTCVVESATSIGVPVVICTLPTQPITFSKTTVCPNDTVTVSVPASASASSLFIWSVNNPSITFLGDNNSGKSVVLVVPPNTGTGYVVNVTVTEIDGGGNNGNSTAPLTVNGATQPLLNGPSSVNLSAGTATYTSPGNANPVWTYAGPGPVSFSYPASPDLTTVNALFSVDGIYTLTVTDNTAPCPTSTTRTIIVSNCDATMGTAGPNVNTCDNSKAVVYVSDFAPNGPLRWYYSKYADPDDLTGYIPVPSDSTIGGVNSTVLVTQPITGTVYFRLRAEGTSPAGCVVFSSPIQVTTASPSSAGTLSPTSQELCRTGSTVPQAVLSYSGGLGPVDFEQSADGITWNRAVGTVSGSTITTGPLLTSTYFRAIFSTACDTSISNPVFIRVFGTPSATITTPATLEVCGTTQTDTLRAIANNPETTGGFWTSSGTGSFLYTAVGSTDAVYTPSAADITAGTVQLKFFATNNGCTPVESLNSITLNVYRQPAVTVAEIPVSRQTICAGTTTDTLRATSVAGTGLWEALIGPTYATAVVVTGPTPAGRFFPSENAPNAIFYAGPTLAGQQLRFRYTATNGVCTPASATTVAPLTITSDVVGGSMNFQGEPAATLTKIFCAGESVVFQVSKGAADLNATFSATGSGTLLYTAQTATTGLLTYVPSTADAGTSVQIFWTVSKAGCSPLQLSREAIIRRAPVAFISSPLRSTNLQRCYNDITALSAISQAGTGQWSAYIRAANGTLTAVPSTVFSDPNASNSNLLPLSQANYANRTLALVWTVTPLGGCGIATDTTLVYISDDPVGSFGGSATVIPDVCAGASTVALNNSAAMGGSGGATLGTNGSTGRWFAYVAIGAGAGSQAAGTFSDPTSTAAFYNSDLADGGKTLRLEWHVYSPACDSVVYSDSVVVLSSIVNGGFEAQRLDGTLTPICFPAVSDTLEAFVNAPATGIWSSTGSGLFRDLAGVVTTNSPLAFYVPDTADRNKLINITWTVTDPSSPTCASFSITRSLQVRDSVGATFPQPPTICFPSGSDTLRGRIQGDPTATGQWSLEPGPSGYLGQGGFTNTTDPNARYIPVANDVGRIIRIVWTVTNNICDTKVIRRDVRVSGESQIVITKSPATTTCAGEPVSLTITGGDAYIWTALTGSPEISFPVVGRTDTLVVRSFENVVFNVQSVIGTCTFTRTYTLNVQQGLPLTVTESAGAPVCASEPVQLTVQPTNLPAPASRTFLWRKLLGSTLVAIPPSEINDSTIINPVVTPNSTTTYVVRALTANGCFDNAEVNIIVNPSFPPVLPDGEICLSATGNDTLLVHPDYLNQTKDATLWFRARRSTLLAAYLAGTLDNTHPSFVSADSILVDPLPAVTSIDSVYYTLLFRSGPCRSLVEVKYLLYPSPVSNFEIGDVSYDNTFAPIDTVYRDTVSVPFFLRTVPFRSTASADVVEFFWDFGDPNSALNNTSIEQNPSHTFTGPGTYTVVLYAKNAIGCADLRIGTNTVIVREEEYLFPNAFSPNGDGNNDQFRPLPLQYNSLTGQQEVRADIQRFQIFDRWGNLIWETTQRIGWNGLTPDGKPFEPGTYTYKCTIRLESGGDETYTGYVTLIR